MSHLSFLIPRLLGGLFTTADQLREVTEARRQQGGVAGVGQQFVDFLRPFVRVFVGEKPANFLDGGQRANNIDEHAAKKLLVAAECRGDDVEAAQCWNTSRSMKVASAIFG